MAKPARHLAEMEKEYLEKRYRDKTTVPDCWERSARQYPIVVPHGEQINAARAIKPHFVRVMSRRRY